ncbi:MAG: DUF721 domain-containing protein [Treponema sp.]|jgi:hypothetical protein|nr:DUF721 domain-containing protein [Treponema sp.]
MKTAGEILSAIFDERLMKKAQVYSELFESWTDITVKNGITAAADHSRIKELDHGILLVEIDHPGWKQIIQTKQGKILNDFRSHFPDMDISGISLILGCGKPDNELQEKLKLPLRPLVEEIEPQTYDDIRDKALKDVLKKLEQNIMESLTT